MDERSGAAGRPGIGRAPGLGFLLAAAIAVAAAPAAAEGEERQPAGRTGEVGAPSAPEPPEPWHEGLKFRSIGPAIGGRVSRVAGVPGDPLTYWVATAQSGVWKSTDGGVTFAPVFDDQDVASIGAIAVAPSDPNVVWVGTGEGNPRGNTAAGDGVYRSTDAGATWRRVWEQAGQIGAMAVHPTNPDVAYAAVLGHVYGPNPERGVYRTENGGVTWKQVLSVDADTGASDVALDPANPRIVFAGTWQMRRMPWGMTSGGGGSGLWRSSDGGETWKRLAAGGLPAGIWGKVGVRVAPSDPRRIYALIEAEEGGLYRSDDGGETWSRANGHRSLTQRAWYYATLTIDPHSPDVVWIPQVPMLRTLDGGRTIQSVDGFGHSDHHDLWIDPADPRRMIDGNDGGVDLSLDGGETWRTPRLPWGQFYNLDVDDRVPYHVGGTVQDAGSVSGPSDSLHHHGIFLSDWRGAGGGEAGDFVYDERAPGEVYAGEYGGYLSHFDEATGQTRMIGVYPTNPSGHGASELRHRFQWTAPIATSPHDPRVLYHGAEVLFRSTDRGATWAAISPDLTRDDETKQQWSGGPITGDNTGVEVYGTIFSVAESPLVAGTIWAGSDDGLVHLTRDGGASWRAVTPPGAPEWGTVESIEPSRFAAATAYVVYDAHRLDDPRPYLFRTRDWGATWERLDGGLPPDVPLLAVREDEARPEVLYLGHERGLSVSRDGGRGWERVRAGLPPVAVVDLEAKHGDLILATRGRSLWILDDVTPLREWRAAREAAPLHLFAPRPAIRWRRSEVWGSAEGAGENPPGGAIVTYWLPRAVPDEVVLEVLDAAGRPVRRLTSTPGPQRFPEDDPDEPTPAPKAVLSAERGLHRVVWDLRHEGARRLESAKIDLGDPYDGPLALPGTYTLRLTAGGRSATATVEVRPDPRSPAGPTELAANHAFAIALRDTISRVVDRIEEVRWLRPQLAGLAERLAGDAQANEIVEEARAALGELDAVEHGLHNPDAQVVYDILARPGGAQIHSTLTLVYDWGIDASDDPPTQGMREVVAEETAKLERLEARLDAVVRERLPRLEALAAARGMPHVLPPPRSR